MYKYYVSYFWCTEKQTGHGFVEMELKNKIRSFEDLRLITKYLNDNIKDEYGKNAKCVVSNYKRLGGIINAIFG